MSENTYIEVRVAAFRLALPAQCVGGVLTDVLVNDVTPFRGERLPVIDLAAVFAGAHRLIAPFAVAIESSRGQRALIGVDSAPHQRFAGVMTPVPKLGLMRPDLFEGAIRNGRDLILVLAPRVLVTL
jgi:hypothetical protein